MKGWLIYKVFCFIILLASWLTVPFTYVYYLIFYVARGRGKRRREIPIYFVIRAALLNGNEWIV